MWFLTLRYVVNASIFPTLTHAVPASMQCEVNDSKVASTSKGNVTWRLVHSFAKVDVFEAIASTFDFLQNFDAIYEVFRCMQLGIIGGIGVVRRKWAIVDGTITHGRDEIHHRSNNNGDRHLKKMRIVDNATT